MLTKTNILICCIFAAVFIMQGLVFYKKQLDRKRAFMATMPIDFLDLRYREADLSTLIRDNSTIKEDEPFWLQIGGQWFRSDWTAEATESIAIGVDAVAVGGEDQWYGVNKETGELRGWDYYDKDKAGHHEK